MSEILLHEAAHFSLPVPKLVEPSVTWGKSPLIVSTDTGLIIYEFEHNVVSHTTSLSLSSKSFLTQKSIPCKRIFEKDKSTFLENQDLTQCRIDPNLWARSEDLAKHLVYTQMWEWLDSDVMGLPVLTTLTNAGSIDIYGEIRDDFVHLINLNETLECKQIDDTPSATKNIQEVAIVCKSIYASAFCWGNKNQSHSYFVSSHRNGELVFWNMTFVKDRRELTATVNLIMEVDSEEIIGLKWIYETKDDFLLICSFLYGRVIGYSFHIENDLIVLTKAVNYWDDNDKMVAKFVEYYKYNDNNVLIFSKHRHLVIKLFDSNYNLLDTKIININDYRIVGVVNLMHKIIVGTFSFEIFEIKLEIVDSKLKIEHNKVALDAKFSNKFYLNAIAASKNNVFWALDVSDRVTDLRRGQTKLRINILYNNVNEMNILLNNPTQKLNNMSDCIELIKFKVSKLKTLPDINYDALLFEGMNNIYKLKIYLILLILYKNRLCYSSKKDNYIFPETNVDKVKDTIFMKHSISLLKNISQIYNEVESLNELQTEVYHGCKINLMEYCKKYEIEIDTLYNDDIDITYDLNYVCQCCDENLTGFTCKENHLNQFCSVTFIPIVTDEYLVCKSCSLTARLELQYENPTCTLCDLPLVVNEL